MSEQIAIDLRVLGHSFRLASTPDKQEELERAAQLLNDKYDEFRRKAPRMCALRAFVTNHFRRS